MSKTLDQFHFCQISKIFQRLMHRRLMRFLDSSKILFSSEFGFRSNHPTEKALCHCIEKIFKTVDSAKFGSAIFIDLQKAFDTVDHEILLPKLNFSSIRGISLEWFRSFLFNRMQSVTVSGCKSKLKRIAHGVPQGSVLGPLLF